MMDQLYSKKDIEQIAFVASQDFSSEVHIQLRYVEAFQDVLRNRTFYDDPEIIIEDAAKEFSSNHGIQARFRGAFLRAYLDIDPFFSDTLRWQASQSGERRIVYPSAYLFTEENGIIQVGNIFPYLLDLTMPQDVLSHYVLPRLEERFEKQVKEGFGTPHTMYSWITPYTQDCSFLESFGNCQCQEDGKTNRHYFSVLIPDRRLSDIVHQMLERPQFVARALLNHCLELDKESGAGSRENNIIQRVSKLYFSQPETSVVMYRAFSDK